MAEVSFTASPGAVLGLLGPNGAGKSTTVGMLAGLLRPDRGSVRIGGVPLSVGADPTKRRLGLVPQEIALQAKRNDSGAAEAKGIPKSP